MDNLLDFIRTVFGHLQFYSKRNLNSLHSLSNSIQPIGTKIGLRQNKCEYLKYYEHLNSQVSVVLLVIVVVHCAKQLFSLGRLQRTPDKVKNLATNQIDTFKRQTIIIHGLLVASCMFNILFHQTFYLYWKLFADLCIFYAYGYILYVNYKNLFGPRHNTDPHDYARSIKSISGQTKVMSTLYDLKIEIVFGLGVLGMSVVHIWHKGDLAFLMALVVVFAQIWFLTCDKYFAVSLWLFVFTLAFYVLDLYVSCHYLLAIKYMLARDYSYYLLWFVEFNGQFMVCSMLTALTLTQHLKLAFLSEHNVPYTAQNWIFFLSFDF
jgi:hypothetical protein